MWQPPLVLLALCVALLHANDPVTRITYMTEEYPPANFTQNGKLTGASVEVLRALWKQMGVPEQPILLLPWARSYKEVQTTPGTMLFTMTWSKEREALFSWVGPIFSASIVLVGRKGHSPVLDSTAAARQYLTAVVRDDISELTLKAQGFTNAQLLIASTFDQSVNAFQAGRVDFLCMAADAIPELAHYPGIDSAQLIVSALVNEQGRYYAFHKSTDPALLQRFQQALRDLGPRHRAILDRYGLHP